MANVLKIEEISEGAILEEDVMNAQGLILLKKGLQVQDKHIKILKRWGVGSIVVSDDADLVDDSRSPEEVIKEKTEEIEKQMNERFAGRENNELMMTIKNAIYGLRVEQVVKRYGK